MLNEADIIKSLTAAFTPVSGVVGIGDDAAVFGNYVVTKDILVEHKHFRLTTTDAASLAHKVLHVNLSDIAAMGAKPLFVLLGVALPATLDDQWVKEFLSGFADACLKQNVQLIGGDTTASDRDVMLSVTVIGQADKKNLKFRHGANAGDIVCVAGTLGEAHAGLMALENKTAGLDVVKNKSIRPDARVAEGQWFGSEAAVTAMMDVSDGLYIDLGKMLQASKTGAVVDLNGLKASTNLIDTCAKLKLDARECMLAGGEDYALLFTVKHEAVADLAKKFEKQFGYPLMQIGTINASGKLELRENGKTVPFTGKVFSHFGEL